MGYRLYVNVAGQEKVRQDFRTTTSNRTPLYTTLKRDFVYRFARRRQTSAACLRTARPDAALRRSLQVRESAQGPLQRYHSAGLEELLSVPRH